MTKDWTKIGAIAGIVAAIGTVLFGTLPYWKNILNNKSVFLEIESIKWSIGNGRLGTGPYAIVKLQFSNTGHTTASITKLHTKFALGSINSNIEKVDCHTQKFTWMGIPWDKMLRGPDYIKAVSIQVPPNEITSDVVLFEPAAVLNESDRKNGAPYKIFACLEVSTVTGDISRQKKRFPLGWVEFDEGRIIDFVAAKESKDRLIVFE